MIHIVADSNVYRADPRREKAAFKTLERLAQTGHVTLHIPEIVRREFLSQEEALHETFVGAIHGTLRSISHRPLDAAMLAEAKKIADDNADLFARLKAAAAKEFADWAASISAVQHPLDPSHGSNMLDAYFDGAVPFTKKKNRDDIPDSFVWQAIQDLARDHNPLYVVSNDGDINKPLEGKAGFVVFTSLENLIASVPVQALLQQQDVSANLSKLLALLPTQVDFISTEIESPLNDEIAWKTVGDYDSEPTINGVGDPENLEVVVEEAVDHGNGLAVVPFRLKVECQVEFALSKSDYYRMDAEDEKSIGISDLNDHYFLAEEERTVLVEGSLSIQVDATKLQAEAIEEEALLGVLREGDFKIDSIEELKFQAESPAAK